MSFSIQHSRFQNGECFEIPILSGFRGIGPTVCSSDVHQTVTSGKNGALQNRSICVLPG